MTVPVDLSRLHRHSPAEYQRLVAAGGFDEDARVELIDGLLVDMGPKTRAHEKAIAWLNRMITPNIDTERYEVRIASPLSLGRSEPEPDVAVVERTLAQSYHPATAELVIEVAAGSLARDLREKPPLYAAAGIPHYWVIDLDNRRAVIHRDPQDGAYARTHDVGSEGSLDVGIASVPSIAVRELLAAAAA